MEQLAPLLEQLAAQLNTTVEFLWGVLLYQAKIQIVLFIVDIVIFTLFTVGVVKLAKYGSRRFAKDNDFDQFGWIVLFIIIGIVEVGWTFGLLFDLNHVITALLNPEYWALQQILEFVK